MVPTIPVIPLDANGGVPLHRQLYAGLRDAILERRLAPGARLPSTRALAIEHGIARNTVALSYDQLRAEGYLRGAERSGTFVSSDLPDHPPARVHRPPTPRRQAVPRLADRVHDLLAFDVRAPGLAGTLPFRSGVPALDLFPRALWARLTNRAWSSRDLALGYGDAEGHPALREAIANYVTGIRGARCLPEQVIVTGGAQQALDITARALVNPGAPVWVEDPGYPGARAALRSAGASIVHVPLDTEGLRVEEGERLNADARVAMVAPSHQYPTGVTMSVARRLALLDWARRSNAWIIEDDYDSEFRYGSRPLPCLQGLDDGGRVVYIGTFSKTLVPALRIGYLIAPPGRTHEFATLRAIGDRHSPTVEQVVLARFLEEGHYGRHVRRMRKVYAERQAILVDAAARWQDVIDVQPSAAGMHVLGWLQRGTDDATAMRAAMEAGVSVSPLSRYDASRRMPAALMLGYAAYDEPTIRKAMDRLGRTLTNLPTQRPKRRR